KRLIERGLSLQDRACAADDIDRLFKDYVAHYAAHIADRSRPFPGLVGALDRLAHHRLAVCTNKLEWLSVHLIIAIGLSAPFIAVDFGYTEIPVAELKPDRIIGHFGALPAAVAELFPGSI